MKLDTREHLLRIFDGFICVEPTNPFYMATVVIDGIECVIHGFGERPRQSAYYSQKEGNTTVKYQMATQIENSQIVNVQFGVAGSTHDLPVLMRSNILADLLPEEKIVVDRGYIKDITEERQIIGFVDPQTPEQLQWNNIVSSIRIDVERVNGYLKKFRVLRMTWISQMEFHCMIFNNLCHMVNLRLREFPLRRYVHPNLLDCNVQRPQ